ncbi:MAG TPA: restriction endonuclease [Acidimicrobiales bacterium]
MAGADTSWSAFEQHVASLYRETGADAFVDYPLSGSQIDVFAIERTPSGTAIHLAVECRSGSQIVGVNDVAAFAVLVEGFRRQNEADVGVIVAESGFSRAAQQKAVAAGIRLVTLDQLERRAVGDTGLPSAARLAILTARQLRQQFLSTVRSAEPLTTFDVDDLLLQVTKVLEQLQEAIETTQQLPTAAPGVRRAVSTLLRVEDEAERCFDAARQLRSTTQRFDEAEHSSAPVLSELDHTAATAFRIREVEQARAHLAYRLRRLEETSYRAVATG